MQPTQNTLSLILLLITFILGYTGTFRCNPAETYEALILLQILNRPCTLFLTDFAHTSNETVAQEGNAKRGHRRTQWGS